MIIALAGNRMSDLEANSRLEFLDPPRAAAPAGVAACARGGARPA